MRREGTYLNVVSMLSLQVAHALKPQEFLWWRYARKLLGYFSTSAAKQRTLCEEAADLDWAYDDDTGNLPIHYIALGTKPSLWVPLSYCHAVLSFCWPVVCISLSVSQS